MKRVFIIHGWQGTPNTHWKPWLRIELERKGFEVVMPEMPNPIYPVLSDWIDCLKHLVGKLDKDTYFVGHSLGCIAIVRYLADLEEGVAGGCVFVAGFSSDLGFSEIKEFYSNDSQVEKAKYHCDKFVTIISDNDKSVPIEKAMEFQKQLGAEIILELNKGHFCEEDGVTELPSARDAILKMSSQ